ncbi:MAG: hypothetical protein ALAOOOJD_02138 [bacterium]|nr:hypothetical protein [bacterium]
MKRIRRFTLFMLAGLVLVAASPTHAQINALDSLRVNLVGKNLALREALQQLVAQTKVQLVYHDAIVAGVKVNCFLNKVTLRQALGEILAPAELTYGVMEDGLIVIMWRGWLEHRGPASDAGVHPPPLGMADPPDFVATALQGLTLTATQKAQIDSIQKVQHEKAVALFRQRQTGALDFENFRSARDMMNEDMMKQMQGVLTKAQYQKFKQELEHNRPPRQGFRPPPPNRPAGGPPPHGRPPRRK